MHRSTAIWMITLCLWTMHALGKEPAIVPRVVKIEQNSVAVDNATALKNIKFLSGKWETKEGKLLALDKETMYGGALIENYEWVDCVIKTKIKINACSEDPWSGMRILIRTSENADFFYWIGLWLPGQRVHLGRVSNKVAGTDNPGFAAENFKCEDIAARSYKLEIGKTYDVMIVVEHGVFHIYMDGYHLYSRSVNDFAAHPCGKVGFLSARATGEVSDISIEPLRNSAGKSPFRLYENNPLHINARSPSILKENGKYRMWFDSYTHGNDLGYAESNDGITWTEPEGTVLKDFTRAKKGGWGDMNSDDAEVLKADGKYWMFYPAISSRLNNGNGWWNGMGMQFSDDGIHWTPYENNPMFDVGPTGSWDSLVVGDHGWIKDGDRFKLWFTGISHPEYGYTNQFGYAESFDGIHWKKCMYNPVLKQGKPGDWDGGWMSCAAVIKLGDKDDELATGVYGGGKGSYHLFYTGWPTNCESDEGTSQIGYAFSLDGVHWVKYHDPNDTRIPYRNSTPILAWQDYGKWGSGNWHSCAVLREGDEVKMWAYGSSFDENHNPVRHLGIATARVSDLLEIVEKAKKEGLLENFDRTQIDAVMYDPTRPEKDK